VGGEIRFTTEGASQTVPDGEQVFDERVGALDR